MATKKTGKVAKSKPASVSKADQRTLLNRALYNVPTFDELPPAEREDALAAADERADLLSKLDALRTILAEGLERAGDSVWRASRAREWRKAAKTVHHAWASFADVAIGRHNDPSKTPPGDEVRRIVATLDRDAELYSLVKSPEKRKPTLAWLGERASAQHEGFLAAGAPGCPATPRRWSAAIAAWHRGWAVEARQGGRPSADPHGSGVSKARRAAPKRSFEDVIIALYGYQPADEGDRQATRASVRKAVDRE